MSKKEEKKPKEKKKSKEQLLKEQVEELTNTLKRVQADYNNYQKRIERDKEQQTKYSSEHIIKKFLPILDNLELALKHSKQKDEFYQGVEMIYANMREMLQNEGIEIIQAVGLPFDPYRHEALMTLESTEEKNTVIEVMQQGYQLHDKIIRPAKVSISKGQKTHKEEKENE